MPAGQPALLARVASILLVVAALAGCATFSPAPRDLHWVATWGAAQLVPTGANILPDEQWRDASLRQLVRVSIGGSRMRVRLTNVFGTAPFAIEAATVARPLAMGSPDVDPATVKRLTFGGASRVVIAAGEERYSDAFAYDIAPRGDLAITLHFKEAPARQTSHPGSRTTSFLVKGDRVADPAWGAVTKVERWYNIADVEVEAAATVGAVAAIGDSITDGNGATTDRQDRWTDVLSERLLKDGGPPMGVVNAGIGGGRLLKDGLGPHVLARFDRDVLDRAGVTHAIVLIGVNDFGVQLRNKEDTPEGRAKLVADLKAGYTQLAERARARKVCLIGATIIPYGSSDYYRQAPHNEADRQEINAWIRNSGTFDAVADFDAATRDPAQPNRMRKEHDKGDGLHTSPEGFRAMAEAVPLAALRRCPRYANPVLSGFHADPSVVRAGDDYYLATSSFEYFPGVPIYHSRDLVHWRQVGNALTRESQLKLAGQKASKGIFAPTLRFHDGTFYMVTSNIDNGGDFYVHTKDPAGEWSEPVWIRQKDWSMDPSLFFDDDGKVYYTRHGGGRNGGVYQSEIDIATGKLAAEPRLVWRGTGGIWPEGPHLYKVGGTYYLLISEGGTSYGHALTVARSKSPWGPFEANPANPILTHRGSPGLPLQAVGHADLVQTREGAWWAVMLGIRPIARHHHIGRETLLAPVSWDAQGWPVVNRGQPLALAMSAEGLPPPARVPREAVRDDFTAMRLGVQWVHLRTPSTDRWSLAERPGTLRLKGSRETLADVASPAFVARRQEHFRMRAATRVEFTPAAEGQVAGLVLRQDEANHYELRVAGTGERRVELATRVAGVATVRASVPVEAGALRLQVDAYPDRYEFSAGPEGGALRSVGSAPTQPLASEKTGGFTGVFIGVYASNSATVAMPPADFDWFDYEPLGP